MADQWLPTPGMKGWQTNTTTGKRRVQPGYVEGIQAQQQAQTPTPTPIPGGGTVTPVGLPATGGATTQTQKTWEEFLKGDPFYLQTIGEISAQGQSAAAERDRLIQQELINFGAVPTEYTGAGVNDLTRSLAQNATDAGVSTTARLNKLATENRRNSLNQLAARGMMQSGDLGHSLDELALADKQRRYDATQNLLRYLHGEEYAYTQGDLQRRMAQIQAQFEVAQRGAQSGVGPLVPGFGADGGGTRPRPYSLPYDSSVPSYQAPAPTSPTYGGLPTPPPGYQYGMVNGQSQLQLLPGWTLDQFGTPILVPGA